MISLSADPSSNSLSEYSNATLASHDKLAVGADDWAITYWLTTCASKSKETLRAYRMQAIRLRAFLASINSSGDSNRLILDATYESIGKFVQWFEGAGGDIPAPIAIRYGLSPRQAARPKVSKVVMRQAVIVLHGMYNELSGALLPGEEHLAVKVNPFAPFRRRFKKEEARAGELNSLDAPGVGKALSKAGWRALIDHAERNAEEGDSLSAMRAWIVLQCFGSTWERRSAVASITWADLQRNRDGVWHIRRERKGKGMMWAPVPLELVTSLLRWRRKLGLPSEATKDELGKSLFWMGGRSAGHDGPLDDKTVYRIIKKLMKDTADEVAESQPEIASQLRRAGAGPHTIRHTMATMYIQGGGDIRVAQTQLGHSSSAMTTKVYDNMSRIVQADAIQEFWANKALRDEPED